MAGTIIETMNIPGPPDATAISLGEGFGQQILSIVGPLGEQWLWGGCVQTQADEEPLAIKDAFLGRAITSPSGGLVTVASTPGELNGKPAFVFTGASLSRLETIWCPTPSYFCCFAFRVGAISAEQRIMGQSGNSGGGRSDVRINQSSVDGQKVVQSGTTKALTGSGNTAADDTEHLGWISYNADDDTFRMGWDTASIELSDTIPNPIDPVNTLWRYGMSTTAGNTFVGKIGSVIWLNQQLHGTTELDNKRAALMQAVATEYGLTLA